MGESTKTQRSAPYPYTFYGSTVYIRHNHRPDGTIEQLEVSKRDKPSKWGTRSCGKILFTRRYAIGRNVQIQEDGPDAKRIIQKRLDDVIPNQFFPAFFAAHRNYLTDSLQLAVVLPYAWQTVKYEQAYADASLEDKELAVAAMMKRFGSWEIRNLSPKQVAPVLFEMARESKKTAKQCYIVFNRIFESVLQNLSKEIAGEWRRYYFRLPRGSYLPTYQVRKRLLSPILNERQCREILKQCVEGVKRVPEKDDGAKAAQKYFAAAIMLIEGISLEEVCALRLDSFQSMNCYAGCYLHIREETVRQGRKQAENRERRPRYSVRELQDPYRCRNLGVGTRLKEMLDVVRSRNADPKALLLSRKNNTKRILPPEDFEDWLEKTFRSVIGKPEIYSDKVVEGIARVSDYLRNTALYMYRVYGIASEELLHHIGAPPKMTDGMYYADFNAESALVKVAKIQDLWLANILPHPDPCLSYERLFGERYKCIGQVCGSPHQVPYMKMTIEIPPGAQMEDDLIVALAGQFGFSASIITDAVKGD